MKTYKAQLNTPNRPPLEVRVQAKNSIDAKTLLDAQYGASGKIYNVTEVR